MNVCIFCQIVKGEIPSTMVYQDEEVTAFRDVNPRAPVHILVVPNRHIPSLAEVRASDGPLLGKLIEVVNQVAVKEGIAQKGYRVVVNCGAAAGQAVPHLHFHVLGGRSLLWPPG